MKLLLNTHDNRRFIKYANKTLALWIEVFRCESRKQVAVTLQNEAEVLLENMPRVFSDGFIFEDAHYLFIVKELELRANIPLPISTFEKKVETQTKRLAEWFRYAYLLPVMEGRDPEMTDKKDGE